MTIDGTIVNVMESWPLQLTVATEAGRYHVALEETTTITRQGQRVDPGELRPGLRLRIEGQASASSGSAMAAQAIDILQ